MLWMWKNIKLKCAVCVYHASGVMLKAVVRSREGKPPSQKALRKSRLIVRNLSFAATEEDVKSACAPFGVVNEIKIPRKEGQCVSLPSTLQPLCTLLHAAANSLLQQT